MPNQPKTRAHSVRVGDEVWQPLEEAAVADGVTMSDIVRGALEKPEPQPHSCQHVVYQMSCKEYDELRERAAGLCELCKQPTARLEIDHDHRMGWYAVRGLLCRRCNSYMRRIDAGERKPDASVGGYLALAWHRDKAPPERLSQRTEAVNFRIPAEEFDPAKAEAAARGETLTDAVRRFIREYAQGQHVQEIEPTIRGHARDLPRLSMVDGKLVSIEGGYQDER